MLDQAWIPELVVHVVRKAWTNAHLVDLDHARFHHSAPLAPQHSSQSHILHRHHHHNYHSMHTISLANTVNEGDASACMCAAGVWSVSAPDATGRRPPEPVCGTCRDRAQVHSPAPPPQAPPARRTHTVLARRQTQMSNRAAAASTSATVGSGLPSPLPSPATARAFAHYGQELTLVAPPPPQPSSDNPASLNHPAGRRRLAEYARRLVACEAMTMQTVVYALLLVSRLRAMNAADPVREGSETELFSAALLLAQKALDDDRTDNAAWIRFSGLSLVAINGMEKEFLAKIGWSLLVTREEYNNFVEFLAAEAREMTAQLFPRPRSAVPARTCSVAAPSDASFFNDLARKRDSSAVCDVAAAGFARLPVAPQPAQRRPPIAPHLPVPAQTPSPASVVKAAPQQLRPRSRAAAYAPAAYPRSLTPTYSRLDSDPGTPGLDPADSGSPPTDYSPNSEAVPPAATSGATAATANVPRLRRRHRESLRASDPPATREATWVALGVYEPAGCGVSPGSAASAAVAFSRPVMRKPRPAAAAAAAAAARGDCSCAALPQRMMMQHQLAPHMPAAAAAPQQSTFGARHAAPAAEPLDARAAWLAMFEAARKVPGPVTAAASFGP
ncbi:hypothetical protein HK405_007540, partial [Cladochytrium tenue]